MILLDTSVVSRVFRRERPGSAERRLQAIFADLMQSELQIGLPGMVLQEVLSGIRSVRQFSDLSAKLVAAFVIVPAGVADHLEAARLRNACLSRGLNVSGIDCLIAATAINGHHELFTTDTDFEAIARDSPLKLFTPGQRA
jgi:predicted nucleic acid-binding protein